MSDRLDGWKEIALYLRVNTRTAQRYERKKGLPIYRRPSDGPKPPVHALRSELERWERRIRVRRNNDFESGLKRLQEALGVGEFREIGVFRRNYGVRLTLKRTRSSVWAMIECTFELVNDSHEDQHYIQALPTDECKAGHVEHMSVMQDGQLLYRLSRKDFHGSVRLGGSYCGPKILLTPNSTGTLCKLSWVVRRKISDSWRHGMVLPTLGVRVETNAPRGWVITPSYSTPGWLETGEYIHVKWMKQ